MKPKRTQHHLIYPDGRWRCLPSCKPEMRAGKVYHPDNGVEITPDGWSQKPTEDAKRRRIIAHRLRAAREEAGLTQAQLAEKTGIATAQIAHYEAGRALPQFKGGGPLVVLAEALDLDLSAVLLEGIVWGRWTPKSRKP